ncbi:hypothetical protein QW060_18085 [Myroides ceti]|uniref:Uncharacterized protein n=1 Tax=Paenimyroides ceti TaxID=395087 RepID=A0ABT8CZG9_9FLAO|nr:hypothetical protein [Paenimyroides ceti]MDN3708987.1 hypothetical protein [Paenimyroides ceti]
MKTMTMIFSGLFGKEKRIQLINRIEKSEKIWLCRKKKTPHCKEIS